MPFLLLLAIGVTDVGRFCHAYISVATAARNGAQYGTQNLTSANDTTGIQAAAVAEMTGVRGVTSSNPTVTSSVINEGSGDYSVRVAVSFRFDSLIGYPGLPNQLNLNRTVHMRVMPN